MRNTPAQAITATGGPHCEVGHIGPLLGYGVETSWPGRRRQRQMSRTGRGTRSLR
jgi:hypothetical protein